MFSYFYNNKFGRAQHFCSLRIGQYGSLSRAKEKPKNKKPTKSLSLFI